MHRIVNLILGVSLVSVSASKTCVGQCHLSKLMSGDPFEFANFGYSVAIEDSRAAVGAPAFAGKPERPDQVVTVFALEGTDWSVLATVVASDAEAGEGFGAAVALGEDVLVVGAPNLEEVNDESGSVYIFRYDGVSWIEEAKITASDGTPGDWFGHSIAVDEDMVVVGAPFATTSGQRTGAAYVYRRLGPIWLEEQKLTRQGATAFDVFGDSVDVSGNIASCAALGVDAIYIFREADGVWTETQRITAADVGETSGSGLVHSLDGNNLAIGFPSGDEGAEDAGSAHVLAFNGTLWVPTQKLMASDFGPSEFFGGALALRGPSMVISAPGDDDSLPGSGSLYHFVFNGVNWVEDQKLMASHASGDDQFSEPVAVSGNRAIVGAYLDHTSVFAGGSAFVFDLTLFPPDAISSTGVAPLNRAAAIHPDGAGTLTSIRIKASGLQEPIPPNQTQFPPPDFSVFEVAQCSLQGELEYCVRWLGKPAVYLESQDNPAVGRFVAARLQCTPYYHDWGSVGDVYVLGAEILPSSTYEVQVVSDGCNVADEGSVSAPITLKTARWGDVAAPFQDPAQALTQPNALDVAGLVNKFKNLPGAPSKTAAQLQPNVPEPNSDLNALDIAACVDALKLLAYPFSGPCRCPSQVPCNVTACTTSAQCVGPYGAGATCVKTCTGGANDGLPCNNNKHCNYCTGGTFDGLPCDPAAMNACPGGSCSQDGVCGSGFCRDRCARCTP